MEKKCPECNTTMEFKLITLRLERNDFSVTLSEVPAYVCPRCGTEIIPGETAEKISSFVEALFKSAQELPETLPFGALSFQKTG